MIEIPVEDDAQRAVWETLVDLDRRTPHGWTLIGAQMVALHGYEHGQVPPRRSRDADILVNVRVVQDGTRRLSDTLLEAGFTFDGMDPEGVGHRFRRGDVILDVLGPEGLREETKHAALRTVPPARTVSVPGGTQALDRTERVPVKIGEVEGTVPRPNLLGAILIKARAVTIDDVPENQRSDLAFLCSLVTDPRVMADELTPNQRKWLRQREELLDPDANAWQLVGAAAEDALRAFRLMAGA
jgi:predicted nucleotidyltransferase